MNNYILEVDNLYKRIGGNEIINDISLKLKPGEIVGIVGENGAGKTTLIELILGLKKMTKGTVKINGFDMKKNFKKAMNSVGSVVESPEAYSNLSGYENLRLAGSMYDDIGSNRINEVIRICGLETKIHDKVSKYPLGLKQRLGLAIALLNNPRLLILDEPMSSLTPGGKENLRNLLLSLSIKNNVSILMTSNNFGEIQSVCNKIYYLENGILADEKNLRDVSENIREKENVIRSNEVEEYKEDYSNINNKSNVYDKYDEQSEKKSKKELRKEAREAKKEEKSKKRRNEYDDDLYVDIRKNNENINEKNAENKSDAYMDKTSKNQLNEEYNKDNDYINNIQNENNTNSNEKENYDENENINSEASVGNSNNNNSNSSNKTQETIYTLEVGSRVKAEKILEENNIELISAGKSSVKVKLNGISAFKMANLLEKNGVRVYEMKKEDK